MIRNNYSVFNMSFYRNAIIYRHKFYVEQAKKRLLSQFNNLEEDAKQYIEDYLKKLDENCDHENDYSDEIDAYDLSCCFYQSLEEMLNTTRNMVIASMFHGWDKELRNWASNELRRLKGTEDLCKKIWSCNFNEIIDCFKECEWDIRSKEYYQSLDRCRLFTNAYKHGKGSSFNAIEKSHKDLIKKSLYAKNLYDEDKELCSEDRHIEEFSDAIIKFWNDVPEHMSLPKLEHVKNINK